MRGLDLYDWLRAGGALRLSLEADVTPDGTIVSLTVRTWDQDLTPATVMALPPGSAGYELQQLEQAATAWLLLISGNACDVRNELDTL